MRVTHPVSVEVDEPNPQPFRCREVSEASGESTRVVPRACMMHLRPFWDGGFLFPCEWQENEERRGSGLSVEQRRAAVDRGVEPGELATLVMRLSLFGRSYARPTIC
jgi:hypothetical protein